MMIARHLFVLALCVVSTIASARGDAVRVMDDYQVVSRGNDQQLEATVTALLALIR